MSKNTFTCCLIVIILSNSCKSQQSHSNSNDTIEKKEVKPVQPMLFDLQVNDLTLVQLSKDTTQLHIEQAEPTGDFSAFAFKFIPKNRIDTINKIRGLYVELKRSENKNIPIANPSALKPLNYHAYAFEITLSDWENIKKKAKEIIQSADLSLLNNYCSSCTSYSMVYNYQMIEDKLTKTNKIQALYSTLIAKYKTWLFDSKK